MNVIGISGLHHSVSFKKREFPHLTARDYRAVHGVDSAAALVTHEGIVAAAAEERFSREKGTGVFPVQAIRYCLSAGALRPEQVDFVAHGFDYEPYRALHEASPATRGRFLEVYSPEANLRVLEAHLPDFGWKEKYVRVPHHLAHAASAFYVSGFEEALILVADGMGEAHNTTVALGSPSGLEVLQQNPGFHSLGILYGVFTLYLGFFMGMDEYKVMGLAPYGDPRKHRQRILDLVRLKSDGTFSIPLVYKNKTPLEAETNAGILRALEELFGPAREPESELTQHHMDVAAGLQSALEHCLMHVLRTFQERTGQRRLCMAGGVALNCTANGLIRKSGLFERMFVQPASGDDGTALGAALYVQHARAPETKRSRMRMPLWGPGFDTAEVEQVLQRHGGLEVTRHQDLDVLAGEVARLLADGKIAAWFQGRMEYGPRALGSRSILADPRDPAMRDRVNRIVKKREEFRPFAPVVKAESAGQWFDIEPGQESVFAHMLFVTDVRPEHRERLPAITHVNGSARVQTLAREDQPLLYALIEAFEALTGVPVLLNTSFNVRGQPIVCTPEEALDTFERYSLDLLVIDRFLVRRAV